MSDPIDYIDLTVDSPVDKSSRPRSRNVDSVPNNTTATKSRKRNLSKRQTTLHDSIVEIPVDVVQKDAEKTEIIDLDNTNPPDKTKTCFVNDSAKENLVVLTCPICYDQLSSKMKPMSTRCGHIFCAQCLELALRKTKRCPTCQRATKLPTCTRLYF